MQNIHSEAFFSDFPSILGHLTSNSVDFPDVATQHPLFFPDIPQFIEW